MGGTVNLTYAPGPGLCYLLRSSEIFRDLTLTGPELDKKLLYAPACAQIFFRGPPMEGMNIFTKLQKEIKAL